MIKGSKKKYNIERSFISKLLESKDMKLLKDLDIKASFLTGENRRVFTYIQKEFKTTGEVPTVRVIKHKFPSLELETYDINDVEVVGTEESLRHWCNELRTKAKHNKTAEATEEVAKLLDEGNTEEAYAMLKKWVWKIEEEVVETTSVDITKGTEDRKTQYLERKKRKGMLGVPSGISHLDYITKGFANETLTTIIATTGIGKTWLEVLIGSYAMINNYKVCVFITEMSTDLMRDRFEAMLFGMICGELDYQSFKSGALSIEKENEYFEFLDEVLPSLEPLIIETATGVSSIVSVIERENPDLILIDGVYLMEDEQGAKDDWLRVAHITRDLKKVAKNFHKPIIINTQADQNTSKKTGPGLSDIKYTQAIGQDSDFIFGMYRDEIMLGDNEMGVRILKNREGTLGKVTLNWDFKRMNFKSIYSENESGDSVEENTITDKEYEEAGNNPVIGIDNVE